MRLDIRTISLRMPMRMGWVNCHLIRSGRAYVLIDSGGSNGRHELTRQLRLAKCEPGDLSLLILTHGDFDHIGNAAYLRSVFGARIAIHRDDARMAERGDMFDNRKKPSLLIATLLPLIAGFGKSERFTPDILLNDGDSLMEHGIAAHVISLPGHSRGSIGILAESGELFCGDLLENIREPAIGSMMDDPVAARASVERLRQLDLGTIYPGHGQPFGSKLPTIDA